MTPPGFSTLSHQFCQPLHFRPELEPLLQSFQGSLEDSYGRQVLLLLLPMWRYCSARHGGTGLGLPWLFVGCFDSTPIASALRSNWLIGLPPSNACRMSRGMLTPSHCPWYMGSLSYRSLWFQKYRSRCGLYICLALLSLRCHSRMSSCHEL